MIFKNIKPCVNYGVGHLKSLEYLSSIHYLRFDFVVSAVLMTECVEEDEELEIPSREAKGLLRRRSYCVLYPPLATPVQNYFSLPTQRCVCTVCEYYVGEFKIKLLYHIEGD